MKKLLLCAALLGAGMTTLMPAGANDRNDSRAITIAVLGDWPYNRNLLNNAPLLVKSINSDPAVSLVIHLGDVRSGSTPCAGSKPDWYQRVYNVFQQFKGPMIYTPGDNEWADCHKMAGDPLKELALVRGLFFAHPGHSLGLTDKRLTSQALVVCTANPQDKQFVENVIWEDSRLVFVTLNVPGSNNDTMPWTGRFANPTAQAQEVVERNGANQRWLLAAFRHAESIQAYGIVIAMQADMWDPAAAGGLSGYTPYVKQLADLSIRFKRPVLLLNGDSHVYGADRPLADPASSTGRIHGAPAVPNLTRITVQGATNAPAEWLRLTIDPRDANFFSWTNVPYCKNPSGACQ
ncbi:metallophosphoesterase family protein [Cupriavidus necator]|uniref:metallophosphoesterase family protein n=1 Tax=Cupriavidus necator TaxID=106590 RepID=UPI0039C1E664